jgi:hypothetical protein
VEYGAVLSPSIDHMMCIIKRWKDLKDTWRLAIAIGWRQITQIFPIRTLILAGLGIRFRLKQGFRENHSLRNHLPDRQGSGSRREADAGRLPEPEFIRLGMGEAYLLDQGGEGDSRLRNSF